MSAVFATAPRWGGLFTGSKDKPGTTAGWPWLALRGVLAITLGVVAFLFPVRALFAFAMVFAAYALVDGIASLMAGLRREGRSWMLMLSGVAGIATAALFVLMPMLMTVSYALVVPILVSAWAIVTGGFELAAAIRLRSKVEGAWLLGLSGLLSVLLGAAVLAVVGLDPVATMFATAWIIGAYALLGGVLLIALAVRLRRHATAAG